MNRFISDDHPASAATTHPVHLPKGHTVSVPGPDEALIAGLHSAIGNGIASSMAAIDAEELLTALVKLGECSREREILGAAGLRKVIDERASENIFDERTGFIKAAIEASSSEGRTVNGAIRLIPFSEISKSLGSGCFWDAGESLFLRQTMDLCLVKSLIPKRYVYVAIEIIRILEQNSMSKRDIEIKLFGDEESEDKNDIAIVDWVCLRLWGAGIIGIVQ